MISFLSILLTFSIVVFVHELGHFLLASRLGVKIYTFSLGFGKELLGFTRKGVRYRLSILPLGGYVKMKGEDPEEEGSRDSDAFMGIDPLKRIMILVSGPLMNFITGMIIFSVLIYMTGIIVFKDAPVIGGVTDASAAYEAGLQTGDTIVQIDGEDVKSWYDITRIISEKSDPSLKRHLLIDRSGTPMEFYIQPVMNEEIGRPLIGITQSFEKIKMNLFSAVIEGAKYTIMLCYRLVESLWLMATGQIKAAVAGPVGIGQLISKAAHDGLVHLFQLIAFISINLGFINLFPIPVLDGGHVVLAILEKLKGSPLDSKKVNIANIIGLSLILTLFLFVTYSDTIRLFFSK